MDKHGHDDLPTYRDAINTRSGLPRLHPQRKRRAVRFLALACLAYLAYSAYKIASNTAKPASTLSASLLRDDWSTCASLRKKPGQPRASRTHNKRWVETTPPLLIRNATIWTGEPAHGTTEEEARAGKGWSWVSGDVFVNEGLIVKVAKIISTKDLPGDTKIVEADGRLLTSGIVDMHSHAGLSSVGNLQDDVNEMSSDITPYVRSIDGLDPLQPEFEYIKSGGVTTSLFLPGSGNNMGGEAYVLKLAVGAKNGREEVSQQDLFADPDREWRYMKMACGENPKRTYGKVGEHGPVSRLGEAWEFRHALEQAQKYVQQQDDWCAAADAIGAENMQTYLPKDLEWESLGAVLRGQVRVNTHCYTIPDLEAFVRHTNEFKFRVYAFHHAHQTYLVPEVLKRAWGGTPAAALFADNMYYKVEAYTASERAGAILYAHNITPTYVSDNPVLNSQHVVFEAAKAYGYGLPYHAALAGVISAPAELLGLGDRIGKIKPGFDADLVLWDSDPLSVGATPVQVWIDGAVQFKDPVELDKPAMGPISPDAKLADELIMEDYRGNAIFKGISYVYLVGKEDVFEVPKNSVAVVQGGEITCIGPCIDEVAALDASKTRTTVLENGYITTPFTAFGSALGLVEIDAEPDTQDGPPPVDRAVRAVDGLGFGGKQVSRAFEHGVTRAISAPGWGGVEGQGVSVGFMTGAKHALEENAVWKEEVGFHYALSKNEKTPSISTAIAVLRAKLLDAVNANSTAAGPWTKEEHEESSYLKRVVQDSFPLIIAADSADVIATLIRLKHTIEAAMAAQTTTSTAVSAPKLRFVIIGGAESHLVASEIANADISIVLAPLLPHAQTWDQRRCLTGAPLTNGTTINHLIDAGVRTAISVEEAWETRDLGLLAGIAYANSEGRLGFRDALDLVGKNIYSMLGLKDDSEQEGKQDRSGWVVWEGSPLEIGGRIRAIGGGTGKAAVWS